MPENEQLIELNKRLGVIVALLLRSLPKSTDSLSLRDQIQLLSELGVRPKDIADILGRTPTYVSKELTTLRKSNRAKR
jgi:DNA-binding CsgD family transcriptional regulator